jgi:hypothetical protein
MQKWWQGGAWCSNATDCLRRSLTPLGSSKEMAKQSDFTGILSNTLDYNPGTPLVDESRMEIFVRSVFSFKQFRIQTCPGSVFSFCFGKLPLFLMHTTIFIANF